MASSLIDQQTFVKMLLAKKGDAPLKEFGPKMGVSFQFMGKVLSGEDAPGPTIASKMGFEQVVAFKKKSRPKPKAKKAKKTPPAEKKEAAEAK